MRLKNFLVLSLLFVIGMVQAQELNRSMLPKIPIDKSVRIGKLPNGLTYYIRHNEFPERVANFYIAQRVGSIQENEDQRGLAHFLEHMAFNGSDNFKGNGIIEYTRSLGVEFGSDLNAYTGLDQTVYRICNVPTKRQSALDSCLLILKDWSNGLLLEKEEIDKERGVIHQEWRMGEGPSMRMIQKALPKMYPGSKYGHRMPIGLMEVVDNFPPQVLRDYYHKWYRPDNQAIIVVGDIDVDYTEKQIKELWKNSTVPANAAKVIDEPVPDNAEGIYIFETDKEQPYSSVSIAMKHDAVPDSLKDGLDYLMNGYAKSLVSMMMNTRFAEMSQKADCPFTSAGAYDGQYILSKTKDAFQADATAKEGKDLEVLATLIKELKKVKQFGFTATEFERAKADFMSAMEKQYTNRNKIKNDYYGDQYRDHYLGNEPIPSIEDEYQIMQQIAPVISVDIINEYAKELISDNDSNFVVSIFAQEKDGKTYPTTEEMKNVVAKARAEKVEAYVDNVKNEPLIPQLPKKGKIVKETENKTLGYKELKLSNGATVILKKTDFKDDEIQMNASAKGGTSLYGAADYSNLKILDYAVEMSGLGNFSNNELRKALAGKRVGVSASFGNYYQSLNGNSLPKDVETMMQLTYLYFTKINKDQESYNSLISTLDLQLKNKNLSPEAVFSDSVTLTVYNHDARFAPLTEKDLKNVNYDRMLQIAKERLSNAGAFTFIFTGNFDEAVLRPLIEQYIASLPNKGKAENWKNLDGFAKGKVSNRFTRKMETPKCNSVFLWYKDVPFTLENNILADAAGQVLSMIYLQEIREENSAAYSVGAAGFGSRHGDNSYVGIQAYCPLDPAKADLALSLIYKGINNAAVKIDADKVQKVKDFMLKQADVDAKKNGYWISVISEYSRTGTDMHTDYKKIVSSITPEKISAFLKDLITSGSIIEVVMTPEK